MVELGMLTNKKYIYIYIYIYILGAAKSKR